MHHQSGFNPHPISIQRLSSKTWLQSVGAKLWNFLVIGFFVSVKITFHLENTSQWSQIFFSKTHFSSARTTFPRFNNSHSATPKKSVTAVGGLGGGKRNHKWEPIGWIHGTGRLQNTPTQNHHRMQETHAQAAGFALKLFSFTWAHLHPTNHFCDPLGPRGLSAEEKDLHPHCAPMSKKQKFEWFHPTAQHIIDRALVLDLICDIYVNPRATFSSSKQVWICFEWPKC